MQTFRRAWHWLMEVWPGPNWFVLLAILIVAPCLGIAATCHFSGLPWWGPDFMMDEISPLQIANTYNSMNTRTYVCMFLRFASLAAAMAYGACRGVWFQPLYWERYRKWLELHAWHFEKKNPVGPPQLVAQDAVFWLFFSAGWIGFWYVGLLITGVGMLFACGVTQLLAFARLGPRWLFIVFLYLASFVFVHVCSNRLGLSFGGMQPSGVVQLARHGKPTLHEVAQQLLVDPLGPYLLVAMVACLLIPPVAVRLQLSRFPWPEPEPVAHWHTHSAWTVGWPTGHLLSGRVLAGERFSRFTQLMICGWLAWTEFHYLWRNNADHFIHSNSLEILIAVHCALAFASLLVLKHFYAVKFVAAPPFDSIGRLWHWRWIIPKHDVIYLGPLAAAACNVVTTWVAYQLKLAGNFGPWFWVLPLSFLAMAFLVLYLPPDERAWLLTGHYHLFRGACVNALKGQERDPFQQQTGPQRGAPLMDTTTKSR